MAIHRVELRQKIGSLPDLINDPVISTDYELDKDDYSISITMNEAGEFYYYTISYDDAGNVSSVSSIIAVTVEKKK
ncbi:MAG: hypothetical protein DRI23_05620 [Candidatus Cloacimonadota bacterium]|nr:MAG: hypothetical protein DRH79_07025 [Candidatus Cloacimonadota bacterium]RLC51134.1 MAG: hypothetical protein DRI23_05620 [Candidatus Cloacimonadota bacterium]